MGVYSGTVFSFEAEDPLSDTCVLYKKCAIGERQSTQNYLSMRKITSRNETNRLPSNFEMYLC